MGDPAAIVLFPQVLGSSNQLSFNNVAKSIGNGRWDWTIFVNGPSETLSRIRCVVYHLDPTFPDPDRFVCDRGAGTYAFALNAQAWKEFEIPIDVIYSDGQRQQFKYHLRFDANLSLKYEELLNELLRSKRVPLQERVSDFSFDQDERHIAVAYDDGSAAVLDAIQSNRKTERLHVNSPIVAIHFKDHTSSLTALLKNGSTTSFLPRGGKYVAPSVGPGLPGLREIRGASFSPTGTLVATRSSDSTLQVWRFPSIQQLYELRSAKGAIWNANDEQFASVLQDKVEIFSVQSRKRVGIQSSGLVDGSFTADGKLIALVNRKPVVPVFSVENGKQVGELLFKSRIESLAFNPDGLSLVAVSSNGTAFFAVLDRSWSNYTEKSLATGNQLDQSGNMVEVSLGFKGQASLTFSPKGRWLAILQSGRLLWIPTNATDVPALLK